MKIAMIMSVYGEHAIGGAERQADLVARHLAERGHELHMISLRAPGTPEATVGDSSGGLTRWGVPLAQLYDPYNLQGLPHPVRPGALVRAAWHAIDVSNPIMAARVGRVLKRIEPDVVITQTLQGLSAAVWAAARAAGARVIHFTHDHALICPGTAMTRGAQACEAPCTSCGLFSAARRALATQPHAVAGPSRIILERHRLFGWFHDVELQRVIPNALPPEWPVITRTPSLRQPLRFGFLGRMDESKGFDTLMEAARLLPAGGWELHVAGGGDPARFGLPAANAAPSDAAPYHYHGVVDAAAFLAILDVLITPSRAHETFCNVVMEAGSLGIPAIVANRGALPERVADGEAGWLFPAGDAPALAALMRNCLEQPHAITVKGTAALALRDQYTAQRQTDAFEALCHDVMALPLAA
jgi:glycosyltransferase involved in cell wall biosynthesis